MDQKAVITIYLEHEFPDMEDRSGVSRCFLRGCYRISIPELYNILRITLQGV